MRIVAKPRNARQRALDEERAALERMKIAAVDMVAGHPTPLLAQARYKMAGKAWVAASNAVVDAILLESKGRALESEEVAAVEQTIPKLVPRIVGDE